MTIPNSIKVLVDFTMGDGWIGRSKGSNGMFKMRIEHSIKQMEYAMHKEQILYSFGYTAKTGVWSPKTGKNVGKDYYRIDVHVHKNMQTAHKWCYNKGRKAIDKALLRQLDEVSLAYWFMDDGTAKVTKYIQKPTHRYYYETPKTNAYLFCNNNFSYDENTLFSLWLKERFGINSKVINGGNNSFEVAIYSISDKDRFRDVVYPYIVPSMQYKINNPHTFKDVPYTTVPRDNLSA